MGRNVMLSHRIWTIIFCVVGVFSQAVAEVMLQPLEELCLYGDALNIEGGLIAQRCLQENQVWANLCFILDRPLHDGVELREITKKNVYPLKEANITSYNERRAALATAAVLKYYIECAHSVVSLDDCDYAKIVVQVHRNSTGPMHVRFLRKLIGLMGLETLDRGVTSDGAQLLVFPRSQVEMELRYGVQPTHYESAHIVLSIGVAAGLNSNWESGTVMLPCQFTPFDLHNMALMPSLTYTVNNHLSEVIEKVVAMQDKELLDAINHRYASANPAKNRKVPSFYAWRISTLPVCSRLMEYLIRAYCPRLWLF